MTRALPLLLLIASGPASAKILFKAGFETGDLSEWSSTGTRGQNATPRNIQLVTDVVHQGKYAAKVTIHEDDVFNAQQLRVQMGGPRVTVQEGSDTYMSFYMYMAEAPKNRDNFFYWEGNPPPRYNNVMTWWVEPKPGGGALIKYGTGNLGRNGTHWEADFPVGKWHQVAMHIRWSEDPEKGNTRLWFDGNLVLDKKLKTKGPESVYFCQPGIHRSPHRPSVDSIYFDSFILADTLEEVVKLKPLDAKESDPVKLQWMAGAPPPPDKLITYANGNFFHFPESRWAFSNIRQFLPTKQISRGQVAASPLPKSLRTDLDSVRFTPIGASTTMTWAESLLANYTDGILILHRGRIIYERYLGVLTPAKPHIAFSVSKSYAGTIAAMLVAEGRLNETAMVASYLPELKDSGYADATIRDLLDMTVGLDYSENYEDPESPVNAYKRAGNFLERPQGYQGPQSYRDFLKTLKKARPHGERFTYMTVNTDALAWVMQRVTGKSLTELMEERFWSKIGMEQDAYYTVDPEGTEWGSASLNLTLRDMARFGEMMRLDGKFHGNQIVPRSVVEDIRKGTDRERLARAGYKTLPGGSYRNQWWILHNAHGAYSARGIHGQAIYIDPKAEMVIVRFGSHPLGANSNYDATSLPAYQAIAEHLLEVNRRSGVN